MIFILLSWGKEKKAHSGLSSRKELVEDFVIRVSVEISHIRLAYKFFICLFYNLI